MCRRLIVAAMVLVFALGMTGCRAQSEKAADAVRSVGRDASDAMDDAVDAVKDATN